MTTDVTLERKGEIVYLLLQREKVNALSSEMLNAIASELEALMMAPPRAVVITGTPVFSGGADIDELSDPGNAGKIANAFRRAATAIEKVPCFTIMAIEGYALGGGLELALAGDFRIAADNASFATPEIKLGLIPGGGATARLPQLIGIPRARSMLVSGNSVTAQDALSWGLVDDVVPAGETIRTATTIGESLAQGPRGAQIQIKHILHTFRENGFEEAMRQEKAAFVDVLASADAHEGIAAFQQKRDPYFVRN